MGEGWYIIIEKIKMFKVLLDILKTRFFQTALQLKLPEPTRHFNQLDYCVAHIAGSLKYGTLL